MGNVSLVWLFFGSDPLRLVKSLAHCLAQRKSSMNVPELKTHGHASSLLRSRHRRSVRSEEKEGPGFWNVLIRRAVYTCLSQDGVGAAHLTRQHCLSG